MFCVAAFLMMLMTCIRHDERGYRHAETLYRLQTNDGRVEDLRRNRCSNVRGFCLDRCMVRSCRTSCFNSSTNDERALGRARMSSRKEANLVEFVKQIRFFSAAMELLLTAEEIDRLRSQTRFVNVNGEKSLPDTSSQMH